MGRTLHYELKKTQGKITANEFDTMVEVSEKYNHPKIKWTCENFYFTPMEGIYSSKRGDYDAFIKHREGLKGKAAISFISKGLKNKTIYTLGDYDPLKELHGFTKTQGNEANSLLVMMALVELSTKIDNSYIILYDEGRFLYTKVYIKGGKVYPIFNSAEDLKWLGLSAEDVRDHLTGKVSIQLNDTQQAHGADDFLNALHLYMENVNPNNKLDYQDPLTVPLDRWFTPEKFVRPVDISKKG